jgi:Ca2+/H+ antiporter, TMEM165/GDT1 family
MQAFLASVSLVTVAEIGDKTQLLSLLLAARYRVVWPIVAGITLATVANHFASSWLGQNLGDALQSTALMVAVALSFVALGAWALIPDKMSPLPERWLMAGPFVASLVLFFVAEIGDKTQLATIALATHYDSLLLVTLGTTLGMLLANIPVICFGEALMKRIPLERVRQLAAGAFILFGLYQLLQVV